MKRKEPESRMHLQWDKLFINNEVFVFSEETGSVELETEIHCNVSSLHLELTRSVMALPLVATGPPLRVNLRHIKTTFNISAFL